MIAARQIKVQHKRSRGVFLHQANSNEYVTAGYFKTALYVISVNKYKNILVIDIVGKRVIWAFESKYNSYRPGIIRFSNLISTKKEKGFLVKGKFIKIK